jgi:hypothetical protein
MRTDREDEAFLNVVNVPEVRYYTGSWVFNNF